MASPQLPSNFHIPLGIRHIKKSHKESIIGTNDDAASCKLSAVNVGYYSDPFVKYFVKSPIRRQPLINRGFFSRVECIEQLVEQFNGQYSGVKKQIVSLGCGFDTYYFRLKSRGTIDKENIVYVEVDYDQVITNKIKIIQNHKELQDTEKLSSMTNHQIIKSDTYRLGPIDLTNMDTFKIFEQLELDYNCPTLFISECVLVYIPTNCGNQVIEWASKNFTESGFITYEQIKPYDEFGKMMIKNIEMKGCPLLSIESFPEIEDQRKRYNNLGWNKTEILDMREVYNHFINKDRIKETNKLEIFDEFEEWDLIQSHYVYVFAIKSKNEQILNSYHFEDTKN
ncbi:hypothetical protein DICPUDRAFT_54123 [Dictyostelium purpureum]|uniref:Leucine carboxyl methyltransferase 1 n=1 Tax=Dictyostelium purpureum TaxID=5786 RepID=F0ZFN4_DICPU|nr:uncharacterized protein DICPUDRAFT_54123 [Dictyostelium purpureum]EGC37241.1 hypothetical protein DICPUDRAFT_54123 [Dictyostelium purpureum]|eukprot:XP_003286211.1 hypothetical protein DICPUDRAFT_54123 [Dictyostelium purpureum]